MTSKQDTVAQRKKALVLRSEQHRGELAATVGGLERHLTVVDAAVTTARRLHRYRFLFGVVSAGLIFVPSATRQWIRRAMWMGPLALEGYRLVKALGKART